MTGYDSKRDAAADKLRDCIHGSLARSCQICDLEAEVEELKSALAQSAQEPVAWVCEGFSSDEKHAIDYWQEDADDIPIGTLLYAAPPQRPWVGLTDEDIHNTVGYDETREMYQFALVLIAKLKAKNS